MEYFHLVESLEASNYLNEYFPDLILRNILLLLLMMSNLLEQVSIVGILHYNTAKLAIPHLPKTARGFIDKSLFITANVGVSDTRQYPYLVQCILFLFV